AGLSDSRKHARRPAALGFCRVRERRRDMKRGTLTRVLLAAVIAVAAVDTARAQCIAQCPPLVPGNPPANPVPPITPTTPPPRTFGAARSAPGRTAPSHTDGLLYIVSGIVFAAVGWAIGTRFLADSPPPAPPVFGPSDAGGTLPPPQVTQVQAPGGGGNIPG